MYTIYSGDKLVYAPNLSKEGYAVLNPKVTLELRKTGSLSFLLPSVNKMYDSLQKLIPNITVRQDKKEIFRGRVLNDEKDFYNRKNVYCEGELAVLLDSQQRPYSFSGKPAELFRQYVTNHNNRVDETKRFEIGEIDVTDPNDYITRTNQEYSKTLDEMKDKLENLLGGYIRPRITDGVRYLDYVTEYGKVNSQTIEFGKNLLDIKEYISAKDVFTVLIPLGAEQTDTEGNSTGRLNITSVNDGKDYIEDETAIALFGRIEKVVKWDDVTLADNLLSKGREFLKTGIEMAVSLKIKAVDLHLIDVDTESIGLGDYVRVASLPHKLDKYFLCSKIVLDLVNPDKTEYNFGVSFTAMTEKQVNLSKAASNSAVVIQTAVQSAQSSANQAANSASKAEQILVQIPTDYVSSETFEVYKTEVNSKISAVYRFKGSVENYESLPMIGMEIGDTYNLLDTGANYAWSDMGWDKLSETIDLTGYVDAVTFNETIAGLERRIKELEGGT